MQVVSSQLSNNRFGVVTESSRISPNSGSNPNSSPESSLTTVADSGSSGDVSASPTEAQVVSGVSESSDILLQEDQVSLSQSFAPAGDSELSQESEAELNESDSSSLAEEETNDNSVATGPRGPDGEPLTQAEQQQVTELRARDAEVRAHEQAHKAVGGRYAGAISYSYQQGPDGKRYAVGGEVPIDVSPISGDPEATIEKLTVVRAAALAPAEPSAQDRNVAAQASQIITEARVELNAERQEELAESRESTRENDDSDTSFSEQEPRALGIGQYIEVGAFVDQNNTSLVDQRV